MSEHTRASGAAKRASPPTLRQPDLACRSGRVSVNEHTRTNGTLRQPGLACREGRVSVNEHTRVWCGETAAYP